MTVNDFTSKITTIPQDIIVNEFFVSESMIRRWYIVQNYIKNNQIPTEILNADINEIICVPNNRIIIKIDQKQIIDDYDKLAIAIINEWESGREQIGRSEIVKGMKYVLNKYNTIHDREVIDKMLITFTGYSLETLAKKANEILDEEVEDLF